MKKIPFLTLFLLCSISGLCAQETGSASAEAVKSANSNWKNWVFAGSALVAAAIGVTIVATNSGSFGH